jgi:hypothetical protein
LFREEALSMKKLALFGMLLFLITSTVPSYGFLDYLFSGSASKDAIDNSAVGDLRAWWTGNPGYQFNPYWSGNQPANQQQGQQTNPASPQGYSPMGPPSVGAPQAPPPSVTYYPQQAPQGAYGQAPPGEPTQSMYGGVPQQYQQAPQQYQAGPQQYQQVPQQYQAPPQQYQQLPQQYQPTPQQYPAPSAYQGAPQAYQGVAQQQPPLPQAYPAGTQQYQGGR